jgi:hypothetical protein
MATPFAVSHQTDNRSVTVLHLGAESTSPTKPLVLFLQILQPAQLVTVEPAILLAPAIVRDLADPDRFRYRHALTVQNVCLTQLDSSIYRFLSGFCRWFGEASMGTASGKRISAV